MSPEMRAGIRRSFRCPCSGERHDLRSYRLTARGLHGDDAEGILVDAEKVLGERPWGCPYAAFRDPRVTEVIQAHRWRSEGSLYEKYGGAPPAWVIDGVETYDGALNVVRVHDIREDRAEREAEAAKKT